MTTTDIVAYHRERSHHFLDLVDEELSRGELEEASNKVWGAAAHAIKALAECRGWRHNAHSLLEEAVDRLVDEEGAPPHLRGQYYIAAYFHQRFYGGTPGTNGIRHGRDTIAEFIQTLENLPDPQP